jgi:hypothetical protein
MMKINKGGKWPRAVEFNFVVFKYQIGIPTKYQIPIGITITQLHYTIT